MKTEIICIIDRSGSMSSIRNDSIGGFNAFLEQQQACPGEARLSLVLFDHEQQVIHSAKDIIDVPQLDATTYVPRGNTALLDAIGSTLSVHKARIKAEGWADKVIVTILTDGEENSSREYTRAAVDADIKDCEKEGWSFVFLAANQDAFSTARAFGMTQAVAVNFAATAEGTTRAYQRMSESMYTLRTGGTVDVQAEAKP